MSNLKTVKKAVIFLLVVFVFLVVVSLLSKTTYASEDILAKQAKLAELWGPGKLDEVATKNWYEFWKADRWQDFNKILKAMPENLVDGLTPDKAVKFLGNKDIVKGSEELAKSISSAELTNAVNSVDDFEAVSKAAGKIKDRFGSLDSFYSVLKSCLGVSGLTATTVCSPADIRKIVTELKGLGKFSDNVIGWTLDGIKAGVTDINKVTPEQVARVVKGYGKNPFDSALGGQQLVKILKSPGKHTIIGSERTDDVLVLRKGNGLLEGKEAWGLDHDLLAHSGDFQKAFGVSDPESIQKIIQDVLDGGVPGISTDKNVKEVLEKAVTFNGKTKNVRVVYIIKNTDYGAVPGDIATAFPFG